MDTLAFDVEDILARKYRYASADKKKEITGVINRVLSTSLNKVDDDFWDFMDKIAREAAANGLTEEKLNKILNED